jgi:hypothetical protein
MKLRLLLLSLLSTSWLNALLAEPPSYVITRDGRIVYRDSLLFSKKVSCLEEDTIASIPIKSIEATKTFTVGDRKGSFNSILHKWTFRINSITPKTTKGLDDAKPDREIGYEGKKLVIKP